jgi:hypothetical protein
MTKKEEKKLYPEWFEENHVVLDEMNSPKVNKLFDYYEKDRYLARVIYMNDSSGYENWKTILFTEKNGHFSIVVFRRKFGISISNRIYSHEKRVLTLTYNGKFWLINNNNSNRGKSVTQATLNNLRMSMPHYGRGNHSVIEIILNKLQERYGWLRFIREGDILLNVSLNTIVDKKLFSLKKALQHQYKVPLPVAKMLKKYSTNVYLVETFKFHLPYIENVESLKEEWLKDSEVLGILYDTLKLAKTLDKKVNCSWSTRRLKEEHDKWSKILTDIIFIDGDREMVINKTFLDFSKFSGYEIITTTKGMAYEGKKQNHCVASYVNKVENGNCGIYKVNEYTLEVVWAYFNGKRVLKINQLRGYSNKSAPKYLEDEVLAKIITFNSEELNTVIDESSLKNGGWDELPF